MSKIIWLTDIHFGVRGNSMIFQDNMNLFFENQLYPFIKENDVVSVNILGDVVDKRTSINFQILSDVNDNFLLSCII